MTRSSPAPRGYEARPHFRALVVCGVIGLLVAIAGFVVGLGIGPAIEVPALPQLPSLPRLPSLPSGYPSLPTDFPTGLPSDLPTDFPSLPQLPGTP
ncbi:hypothetical protein [Amycolatopsis sp.]|uniref:hypothetical protein n=1 Tax=Amycolatopsis sp. TaxID=37632 RepID=UPI002C8396AA|nr:hypothetical protein [Amycolatopsis sp.]HVV13862.1 hypothetical protein [Amycolatopsis sp.]